MPKDTKSLDNNKAPACESRGFVPIWHVPRPPVYARTQKSSYEFRNCLIFKVDQLGLEPRTSRL